MADPVMSSPLPADTSQHPLAPPQPSRENTTTSTKSRQVTPDRPKTGDPGVSKPQEAPGPEPRGPEPAGPEPAGPEPAGPEPAGPDRPNTADRPQSNIRAESFLKDNSIEPDEPVTASRPKSTMSVVAPTSRPVSARSRNAWTDDTQIDPRPVTNMSGSMAIEDGILSVAPDNQIETPVPVEPKPPSNVVAAFRGIIHTIWFTKDTENTAENRQLYMKTTLRELIVYILFLLSLCIITFGMSGSTMYYYHKVMSELFLDSTFNDTTSTFRMATTTKDFFRFTDEVLMNGLYGDSEEWYNGNTVRDNNQGYVLHENKLLGVARLRTKKVTDDSCVVHEDFAEEITSCYAAYAPGVEYTGRLLQLVTLTNNQSTAYTYRNADEIEGSTHSGQFGSYSGSGYIQKLNLTREESLLIIQELKENLWLDRGTRVVFVDFTTYNANINLFCVVRLTLEFPATGGAVPSWHFRAVKLIRYVSLMDYCVLAFEILFIFFIIYYSIEEAIEIEKHRLGYFKHFWNILDIMVILISYICIVFNVYRTFAVSAKLDGLLKEPNEYPDFEFLSYWQVQFNHAIAVAVFMAWVKVFKYISFNKTMSQLSSTLSECAIDLVGFAIMFMIIFIAFAQLGYLIFGTQVKDFSSVSSSIFTLFRIVLGDFNFQDLEKANRVLGPIYFIMYVFFVFFVLLNMFLAIINDTYTEVKSDIGMKDGEFNMTDYFKQGYNNMITRMNIRKEKITDIQNALNSADDNNDKKVSFDEWKKNLILRGYEEEEIEVVFAEFDIDGDRNLDEAEQIQMMADLEGQKIQLSKKVDNLEEQAERETKNSSQSTPSEGCPLNEGVPMSKFKVLTERVDSMETSIGQIVSKIDAVLVKLEAMERAKSKRRETMNKILESINAADGDDASRREGMERLVREELERWDTESFLGISPSASRAASRAGVSPNASRPASRTASRAAAI